ncbi:YhjD/YihY/BrkB family envelope integrity protein [Amycolatopsis sp. 195334CR]|uniref:YhjD/YihY/BrkB family envelope integrity protein n=1 Tax=Amycolatopsis sp. 195334CR TaxID=2814588 RepID=UPI001A8D7662|nr:YhjD/YihY/BrkB family envelope integrity protein [Amycolatopsis sp. 195334CR]MBN6036910.1 YihY/virulence factor BrkB family protein [Amycolatopsis sp. 195334CR]
MHNLPARLRARYRSIDHLFRAVDRYLGYHGYHYVASITYFSLLSVVPMLMVAFSVAGYVLAGQPELLKELSDGILRVVPGPLGEGVGELLGKLIEQRTSVGVFGLLIGLYSGWNWINSLRDALTAMWDQDRTDPPLLQMIFKDFLALLSLVAALIVSFALTVSGGAFGDWLLRLTGLDHTGWAATLLGIGSVVLALLANALVFLWVLVKLPRQPVGTRSGVRGAIAAAIGFELLKQAGGIYLRLVSSSPTGAAFGSVIGVLVFISLVSRMLVFLTAWTATARDAPVTVRPPSPVVIRPVLPPRRTASALPAAAGVLTGVIATLGVQRHRRRRRGLG